MAEVDLCRDRRLGRLVARKSLRRELQGVDVLRRRFDREIQIQAQLDHPAIVPVFDRGQSPSGREYFTMRSIEGETLNDAVGALARLPPGPASERERSRLIRAFLQACLAIDYAHHRGIVHRDLKPANLMLGQFGEVYVLDWGIAKVVSEPVDAPLPESEGLDIDGDSTPLTGALRQLGTPAYMSPEQFQDSSSVTPSSDVYALGAVLFQILAQDRLRLESAAVLRASDGGTWPQGPQLHPSVRAPELEIPPEYDAICARACDPDPDERYGTARDLHDAVEAVWRGDRDLALRRDLSERHLDAALGFAADHGSETEVLREAGRAVALDPTNSAAAGLLTRYLLATADDDPVPLVEEREQADLADGRGMLVLNAAVSIVVLTVIALLATVTPILRWELFAAGVVPVILATLVLVSSRSGTRPTPVLVARSLAVSVGFSAPIALSSTAFGPWALPPLITCVVCVVVASVVAIGWRRVLVVSFAMGTLAATQLAFVARGSELGLRAPPGRVSFEAMMVSFGPTNTTLIVGFLSFVLVVCATAVVWHNSNRLLLSRQQLHRYEWRLRQITNAADDRSVPVAVTETQ